MPLRPSNFRLRLFVSEEYKPLRLVSPLLWAITLLAITAQIVFSIYLLPPPAAIARDYAAPPPPQTLRVAAFGAPATLAKLLALNIQTHDNQPGISIPFAQLNYDKLGQWLDRAVSLDERAEYPHFLMAKVYSAVRNNPRRYIAVTWVWRQFLRLPNERWWWMAHATNFVKHELKNDEMALLMAQDLRQRLTPGKTPNWPRQMEAFFLENNSEFDAAAAILQNQLAAGEITDPQEFAFLLDRLEGIIQKMYDQGHIQTRSALNQKLTTVQTLRQNFLNQFKEEEETPPQ